MFPDPRETMSGIDPFDAFSDPDFEDEPMEPDTITLDHTKLPEIHRDWVPVQVEDGMSSKLVYFVQVEDYNGERYIHHYNFDTYKDAALLAIRVQEKLAIDLEYWWKDSSPDFVNTFPDYVLDPHRPEFN